MKKTILLTACLALTLGGCAEMDTKPTAAASQQRSPARNSTKMIADAEKEIAAAKKGGCGATPRSSGRSQEAKAEGKATSHEEGPARAQASQLVQKQVGRRAANGKLYFPN